MLYLFNHFYAWWSQFYFCTHFNSSFMQWTRWSATDHPWHTALPPLGTSIWDTDGPLPEEGVWGNYRRTGQRPYFPSARSGSPTRCTWRGRPSRSAVPGEKSGRQLLGYWILSSLRQFGAKLFERLGWRKWCLTSRRHTKVILRQRPKKEE
jgi:hypothetical protein